MAPSPVAQAIPRSVVSRATSQVAEYLDRLDADCISTQDAAERFREFCELERLCAAAKVLLSSRAAESQVWKDEGHRSPAEWMASTGGTGIGDAVSTLEMASRLAWLPETEDALRHGALSSPQLKEITAAANQRPSSEKELLEAAATSTLKGLREHCRNVLAESSSAEEENERYLAIRGRRSFRSWTDVDGAFKGALTLTPDDGARLLAVVQRRADELFDEARKSGTEDAPAAYRADALVDLLTVGRMNSKSGSKPSRGRVDVSIHVDAAALRRGHVRQGEKCEIRGVGPVPVATVNSLLPEAFVKLLVTDGVDVTTVCHIGRKTLPATLRTALEARDAACVVPGCDVALGLEYDHVDPVENGGPTCLDNLARLCHFHHAQKTYAGYSLSGGPGHWVWEGPSDRRPPGGSSHDPPADFRHVRTNRAETNRAVDKKPRAARSDAARPTALFDTG